MKASHVNPCMSSMTFVIKNKTSGSFPLISTSSGRYRRNLITLKENSRFITCWSLFGFVILFLTIYCMNTPNLSPVAIFWIYNGVYFTFIQVFHGLVVPWQQEEQKL